MGVYCDEINIETNGENDIVDITSKVQKIITICNIFVAGSTGTISTIEYEPGLKQDFPRILEKIAPKNQEYKHHETWHDDNGRSHVKASIMGPSSTFPIKNAKLIHGTWQQLVFIELDTRPRNRNIIVNIVGE